MVGACVGAWLLSAGRVLWLVLLQVLARYGGLGLATLEEHVLVQGQPHSVLGPGAHSVVTGDLWDEKFNQSVFGFCKIIVCKQS